MESLLHDVAWVPTIVAFVLSFLLGWLWYSPKMFLSVWQEGLGAPQWQAPMWMPMLAQVVSTLILSIIMGLSLMYGHINHALLMGLMLAGFVKANGLYCGKSKKAISVEVGYIVVMVILMIVVHSVL